MDAHELIAPYALDALDADERDEFEAHLRTCERCRAELPALREAAAAMAFAAEASTPPDRLRGKILDAARAERSNVVPLRPWKTVAYVTSGMPAAAAALAIGLGIWGVSVSNDLDAQRQASALLADPNAQAVAVDGADGRLVVSPDGEAALVVSLDAAPAGKTYEAWVIRDGEATPAGVFETEDGRAIHVLDEPVAAGETVAVTLEREGGADAPSGDPLLTATLS